MSLRTPISSTRPNHRADSAQLSPAVMRGLVPRIHVFRDGCKDVDARDTSAFTRVFRRAMRGHDALPSIDYVFFLAVFRFCFAGGLYTMPSSFMPSGSVK